MTAKKLLVAATLLLLALPAAAAEETKEEEKKAKAPTALAADGSVVRGNANSPWRGSSLSYEHVMSTISLDKGAELTWNPYYAQSVSIAPRYWLSDSLFAGIGWSLEKELTNSDWTTERRQLMWSDVFLSLGWSGWQEPNSGIRITGTLQAALPVSLVSQAQTQLLAVAPALRIARNFAVGTNLNVAWNARWNQRFHDEPAAVKDGNGIIGCDGPDCSAFERAAGTGVLNAWGDLSTGPSVVFSVMPTLHLFADMRWTQSFLYENAEGEAPVMDGVPGVVSSEYAGQSSRYGTYFGVGAAYDLMPELTVYGSVATPSPQLRPDGERRSPFFNRFTQASLGLTINLEPLASRVLSAD